MTKWNLTPRNGLRWPDASFLLYVVGGKPSANFYQLDWTDVQLPAGNNSNKKKISACELCLISPAVCEPCCRHTVGLVYISYRARCLGRSIEAARYPDGGRVESRRGGSALRRRGRQRTVEAQQGCAV